MIASDNRGQDRTLDGRPIVDHLLEAEAKHSIPHRRERGVSPAVVLECAGRVVERATVDFDDESVSDDEVDVADTRNVDLTAKTRHAPSHSKPEERLDPGFASPVDERAVHRMRGIGKLVPEVRSTMEDRLERGQVELAARTPAQSRQSGHGARHQSRRSL